MTTTTIKTPKTTPADANNLITVDNENDHKAAINNPKYTATIVNVMFDTCFESKRMKVFFEFCLFAYCLLALILLILMSI